MPLAADQKYFDLGSGQKIAGIDGVSNYVGMRGMTEGKFLVDDDFFEKIASTLERMKNHVSVDGFFSPEELIGFYTWSEMSEHEKNMAILVLKELARSEDEPLFEVESCIGVMFKFDPVRAGAFGFQKMRPVSGSL